MAGTPLSSVLTVFNAGSLNAGSFNVGSPGVVRSDPSLIVTNVTSDFTPKTPIVGDEIRSF
jgi:hypothetical protein